MDAAGGDDDDDDDNDDGDDVKKTNIEDATDVTEETYTSIQDSCSSSFQVYHKKSYIY